MRSIWKFNLQSGKNMFNIPKGYKVLSVAEQSDNIVLYCLVNPRVEKETVSFAVFGTGWELHDGVEDLEFIGTVSTHDQYFMWHVFKN